VFFFCRGGEKKGGGEKRFSKKKKLSQKTKLKKSKSNRRPLDVGPYLKHLARKYGPLYELPEGRAEELVAPGLKLASEALERAK